MPKTRREKRKAKRAARKASRADKHDGHADADCELCASMRRGDVNIEGALRRMLSSPSIEVGGLWADGVRRTMTPQEARAAGITFSDEADDD